MAVLVWDKLGEKKYETGLDRAVLYLEDGSAVPWNGLVSVVEKTDRDVQSVYYDGKKINELVSLGDFSATMTAMTYPDEFVSFEGAGQVTDGVLLNNQKSKLFSLCYRTRVGNDVDGDVSSYKIHLIYNVTAVPSDKSYETATDGINPVHFEWSITAIPEEISGFSPTAHIIINSSDIDPLMLSTIEDLLYGNDNTDANLMPLANLIDYVQNWHRITIVDNGNGTWTAVSALDSLITLDSNNMFTIINANADFLNSDTYEISDTTSDE
jgi:hypothetical protein